MLEAAAGAGLAEIEEFLILSNLSVSKGAKEISVAKVSSEKCERCWHWETEVGANAEHPTLCPRCVEAVKQCNAT